MSYTVMSDEILKVLDSKIYYAVTKIWNDRKRSEINTMHKKLQKPQFSMTLLKIVYKIELINY